MFGWNAIPQLSAAVRPLNAAVHMPVCMGSHRVNCIVDGDTIWYHGEKIRLSGFNAPEMHGNCPEESNLAWTARDRLRRLLSDMPFSVERHGHDVYGRTLAVIRTSGGDVSDVMVREKLAHYWHGYKEDWCAKLRG
jgi:endonuclease YncB( thermonuclease family)